MNNKILKELGLPSWLADDDMVEVKVIKLTKAITQARADERKKVLAEITEIKDLKQSEKGKSLDYWEGYTSAVVKMVKKL